MEVAPRARFKPRAIAVVFALLLLLAGALAYVPARNAFYLAWHAEQVTGEPQVHAALRWIKLPDLALQYHELMQSLDGVLDQQGRLAQGGRQIAEAAEELAEALANYDSDEVSRAAKAVDNRLAELEETHQKVEVNAEAAEEARTLLQATWEQRWPGGPLGGAVEQIRATRYTPDQRLLAEVSAEIEAARLELEEVAARQLDLAEQYTGSELAPTSFATLELPDGRFGTQRVEAVLARLKLLGRAHLALDRADALLAELDAAESAAP